MVSDIILPVTMGLALFLFGMKVMEVSLQAWAGPRLIKILEVSTHTPWRGLCFSTLITAILQSSTATTVMTIGLVNAGIMSYAQTLGIILGGNIGTCLTTELIALNLASMGPTLFYLCMLVWVVLVLLDTYMPTFTKSYAWLRSLQLGCLALAGFSLIMIAIQWMQSVAPALEARGTIAWLTAHAADNILWGVLAGIVITALIHSSAATIAITMGLVGTGLLPMSLGIAMVLGSNVGTCITALIASIGGTRSGSFVAWSHVILNVAGAILFLPLIPALNYIAVWLSSDPSSQIAHIQTIFNVVCSLIALPICYLPLWSRLDAKQV
ncbi:phosphate:Na+ symporter [Paenibacillus turicensis]|uniref:Phosphate:Na+ symporter n=1 Tax=Paenibacillus turicensis TaxID=160487 RepID=A0ABS4FNZ0_9BACL|nr:Na/Pi symporter [Paenibacillus turicensis]MBP1904298.1 phosphate:Na+ symporter [Paenibacillus turicensis]